MSAAPHDDHPWLLSHLATIRTLPGSFLGDERVETLRSYLAGYEQAREDLGLPRYTKKESKILSDFDIWIAKRVGYELSWGSSRWPQLIKEIDSSKKSAVTFFRVFEEFLQSNGTSLDEAPPWRPRRVDD